MSFSGMDAVSGAAKTNVATFFFTLKPWGERKAPGDSSFDLARKLYGMGLVWSRVRSSPSTRRRSAA